MGFILDTADRVKLERLIPGYIEKHGLDHVLSLIERLGPDFLTGLIASERHAPPQPIEQERIKPVELPQEPKIRVWARLGMAAIDKDLTGAYKLWELARHFGGAGRTGRRWDGIIDKKALRAGLAELEINSRTGRRWLGQALEIGFLTYDKRGKRYKVTGLAQAARILKCWEIGNPADISLRGFVRTGWGSHVWQGYEATKRGKVMSQAEKTRETGVSRRRQCNYLNGRRYKLSDGRWSKTLPPAREKRKNFLETDLKYSDLVRMVKTGAGEEVKNRRSYTVKLQDGTLLFWGSRQDKVYRRLPNIVIPLSASFASQKRVARRARARLKSSQSEKPGESYGFKLFYETSESLNKRLREFIREGVGPEAIFKLKNAGRFSNVWKPVQLAGVVL